ncbi:MAG: hypothetical protein ACHQ1D_00295 [Nitrososphaerales archaeon]
MATATIELTYTKAQNEIFFSDSKARFTIVRKGRRVGGTKGACNAIMEWLTEGISPCLWVDTINGNIDRYYERYIYPELKKSAIKFDFNYNKKQLKIRDYVCDFRSADSPESIEGFGYKKIILNEAGIILKDNYLYTNTILPMLIDYSDSQLFAIGTPKGKYKRDGTEHIFYQLASKTGQDYRQIILSTYDNPFLSIDEIKLLENEIALLDATMVRQEIYGEFIEAAAVNPFFTQYSAVKHESTQAVFDPQKQLYMSIDFNINPFCIIFFHFWKDAASEHLHFFDELQIKNGSIPQMIDEIKMRYGAQLPNCRLTGDAMGKRREIAERDNASYYLQLQRGLGLRDSQIQLPANPSHENSRADCNYVLYHFPDIKFNPEKCKGLCRDMKIIQCDSSGSIIKSNRKDIAQNADFGDCTRYAINTFLFDFIKNHSKKAFRN